MCFSLNMVCIGDLSFYAFFATLVASFLIAIESHIGVSSLLRPVKAAMLAIAFSQQKGLMTAESLSAFAEGSNECLIFGYESYLWLYRTDGLWVPIYGSNVKQHTFKIPGEIPCHLLVKSSPINRSLRMRSQSGTRVSFPYLQLRSALAHEAPQQVAYVVTELVAGFACDIAFPDLSAKLFLSADGFARLDLFIDGLQGSFRGYPWRSDCLSSAKAVDVRSMALLMKDVRGSSVLFTNPTDPIENLLDVPYLIAIGASMGITMKSNPKNGFIAYPEFQMNVSAINEGWAVNEMSCGGVQVNGPIKLKGASLSKRSPNHLCSYLSEGFVPLLCAQNGHIGGALIDQPIDRSDIVKQSTSIKHDLFVILASVIS